MAVRAAQVFFSLGSWWMKSRMEHRLVVVKSVFFPLTMASWGRLLNVCQTLLMCISSGCHLWFAMNEVWRCYQVGISWRGPSFFQMFAKFMSKLWSETKTSPKKNVKELWRSQSTKATCRWWKNGFEISSILLSTQLIRSPKPPITLGPGLELHPGRFILWRRRKRTYRSCALIFT